MALSVDNNGSNTRVSPSNQSSSPSHQIRSQGSPASVGSVGSPNSSVAQGRSPYYGQTPPYPNQEAPMQFAYHNRYYQPIYYPYPPPMDSHFLYQQYRNSPEMRYNSPQNTPQGQMYYTPASPYFPTQPIPYYSQGEYGQGVESMEEDVTASSPVLGQSQNRPPALASQYSYDTVMPDMYTHEGQSPPPNLERGFLAQANLRNAVYGRPQPISHQYPEQMHRKRQQANNALPKPPPHSEFALWVGNVPTDSSHSELWRFFTGRPSPASVGVKHGAAVASKEDAPDLGLPGVQSIHLIARSNCCFVNYASQAHLDHAIQVVHGISLRPLDPRIKPLVCRIRKIDDDTKTGVGAQRGRGLHHQWTADQAQYERESEENLQPSGLPSHPAPKQQSSGSTDLSTASTSSSFLSRHFAKRYFILKSHTEEDLVLSGKQSLWATQSHNEPILDQAFRTSSDGVFLIFSANRSGEFFGFAKMAGPINPQKAPNSTPAPARSATKDPQLAESPLPFSEFSHVKAAASPATFLPNLEALASSPQPVSPGSAIERKTSLKRAYSALRSVQSHSMPEPTSQVTGSLPEDSIAARRGASLDTTQLVEVEEAIHELSVTDSVPRSASLPIQEENEARAQAAAHHNAHLEEIEDETEGIPKKVDQHTSSSSVDRAWGRPFKIEWIKMQCLPFGRTRHVKNSFNKGREVKISRDGTELDPIAGEALLALFFNQGPAPGSPY